MDIAIIQSVWTVVVFVLFVGIVFWAFSSKQKASFDDAANSLLEDDDSAVIKPLAKENNNG